MGGLFLSQGDDSEQSEPRVSGFEHFASAKSQKARLRLADGIINGAPDGLRPLGITQKQLDELHIALVKPDAE